MDVVTPTVGFGWPNRRCHTALLPLQRSDSRRRWADFPRPARALLVPDTAGRASGRDRGELSRRMPGARVAGADAGLNAVGFEQRVVEVAHVGLLREEAGLEVTMTASQRMKDTRQTVVEPVFGTNHHEGVVEHRLAVGLHEQGVVEG